MSAATSRKTISNTPNWNPKKSAPKVTSGILTTSNPVAAFDYWKFIARRMPLVRQKFSRPFSAVDAFAASVRTPKAAIPPNSSRRHEAGRAPGASCIDRPGYTNAGVAWTPAFEGRARQHLTY
jgi:hypothetical protein